VTTSAHLLHLMSGTTSKEAATLERSDIADERFLRDCEAADDAEDDGSDVGDRWDMQS
jgi:hypothetical protein